MKILKKLREYITPGKIVIIIFTVLYSFIVGPISYVYTIIGLIVVPRLSKLKLRPSKAQKLINGVDESGDYEDGKYRKSEREFKRRWKLV